MRTSVKGLVLLLAALAACAAYVAPSSRAVARARGAQEKKGPETTEDEQLERAKTLFGERCVRCHGADGRSQTVLGEMLGAPDFTDPKWWKEGKSNKRLVTSVTEGRDEMPAFGKKLSQQEIGALVSYVRRFNRAAR